MAQPYWTTEDVQGCQATGCSNPAGYQWRRAATPDEIAAELNHPDGYPRNPGGPHDVAVFSCSVHVPAKPSGDPDWDKTALRHTDTCPAPDPGCACV